MGTVGFSLFSNTNEALLPTDNSLPDHLPALDRMSSDSLNLEFEHNNGGVELQVSFVDFIDDGVFASEQEMYEKQDEINEFVQNLYPELGLSVRYDVTDLTELPQGTTPHNPVLPNPEATPAEGFEFTFEAGANDFTFVDPEVAVGYDYEVLEEANFLAVLLPEGIGDNSYDLLIFDEATGEFVDTDIDLEGGVAYTFEDGGLGLFRILGIEVDENLDPDDPEAFVTGLKFMTDGAVKVSQTSVTQTVVPVPASAVFFYQQWRDYCCSNGKDIFNFFGSLQNSRKHKMKLLPG